MGLGVWFSQDIAHVLRGVGDGVESLVAQRGLLDGEDAAYVAGYRAALQAVALGLGLVPTEIVPSPARPMVWVGSVAVLEETTR
ncbi:MAG: hypothetical protein KKA73_18425 [Chloroflexi bacterium]|nr:hypothetical protein [Chloroflexota bacterium]MBU1749664.1 hypothetical protein [Chloroflexota bacterium]